MLCLVAALSCVVLLWLFAQCTGLYAMTVECTLVHGGVILRIMHRPVQGQQLAVNAHKSGLQVP